MKLRSFLISMIRCLEKFESESRAMSLKLKSGHFEGLADFSKRRERMIHAISLFKRKALEVAQNIPKDEWNAALQNEIDLLGAKREELVSKIFILDTEILSLIEQEQERLLHELKDVVKQGEAVSKMKSGSIDKIGSELDKTL